MNFLQMFFEEFCKLEECTYVYKVIMHMCCTLFEIANF